MCREKQLGISKTKTKSKKKISATSQ